MTSFFGERMSLVPPVALTLALALALAGAGCREQPTETTSVELTRDPDQPCVGPMGGALRPMDTYVLQLYWVIDPTGSPEERPDCQRCVRDPQLCQLDRQHCRCGGETVTSPDELGHMVSGSRIEDVDADALYCLRVIA